MIIPSEGLPCIQTAPGGCKYKDAKRFSQTDLRLNSYGRVISTDRKYTPARYRNKSLPMFFIAGALLLSTMVADVLSQGVIGQQEVKNRRYNVAVLSSRSNDTLRILNATQNSGLDKLMPKLANFTTPLAETNSKSYKFKRKLPNSTSNAGWNSNEGTVAAPAAPKVKERPLQ